MPTATLEEYLETIYKLGQAGEVRPSALAEALEVSPPTVTATLKRLARRGLVDRPAGAVTLTESGRLEALSILRRHRLAERLLVDVLGLRWEEAHEEACRLEHALSPRVQEALEAFLDNPEVCPHGHPIPAADLTVEPSRGVPLTDAESGSHVTVIRVGEDSDEMLIHLSDVGLVPGTSVEVVGFEAFDGPVKLVVAGRELSLSRQVAAHVIVSAGESPASQ